MPKLGDERLGAWQCQQCGGSPCVCETIGACYSMAEWEELLAAFDEVARAADRPRIDP